MATCEPKQSGRASNIEHWARFLGRDDVRRWCPAAHSHADWCWPGQILKPFIIKESGRQVSWERDRQPQAITGNRQRKLIINQRNEPIQLHARRSTQRRWRLPPIRRDPPPPLPSDPQAERVIYAREPPLPKLTNLMVRAQSQSQAQAQTSKPELKPNWQCSCQDGRWTMDDGRWRWRPGRDEYERRRPNSRPHAMQSGLANTQLKIAYRLLPQTKILVWKISIKCKLTD